ncbi:MAG TPA: IS110 family transposase [Candidatus Coprosoma intestinipullorum]|uniref:IS110 family transposase n=1 Tax=Candidatus Coprosoma intestinipullorum TaxID=2840752 RepID=A0A9D0ZRF6_9FIRM|nr:IS110 family transposase [Candidatus Coprosoma intestinipullorum]
MYMIYVGIDISKYKHDCFICNSAGEVIVDDLSFENNKKGFQQFLDLLKPYDNSNVRIGLEATGHYGLNLKLFLEKNNYTFMEFNPLLIKEFKKSLSLRKTKTDKIDTKAICQKLMSVPYKPNSKLFYHKYGLKSLSRLRETLVKQRSKYMVQLTNVLDIIFPEFKPFFNNKFSATSLYLLGKYKSSEKMAKMRDFETPNKISRGSFTYAKFAKLKELAKNSIGESDETFEIEFDTILNLYNEIDSKINSLDKQISTIVKELNPPTLSIPGIGELTTAVIISEFGDFSKFSNSAQLLSFAGLEPGIYQSGTMLTKGKMVKRGSGYLRGALMNIANVVIKYNPTFYDYYLKKRSEGKCHRVALSHVCKKLLRVIYKLETQNIQFDPSLLK